jgi:hypothetical protein
MHAYMHTHTHMHTYIHAYMHACIHTYIHTYVDIYIHACIHTYIHIHTYMNHTKWVQRRRMASIIHTCIHTYTRTHTYIHTWTTGTIYQVVRTPAHGLRDSQSCKTIAESEPRKLRECGPRGMRGERVNVVHYLWGIMAGKLRECGPRGIPKRRNECRALWHGFVCMK